MNNANYFAPGEEEEETGVASPLSPSFGKASASGAVIFPTSTSSPYPTQSSLGPGRPTHVAAESRVPATAALSETQYFPGSAASADVAESHPFNPPVVWNSTSQRMSSMTGAGGPPDEGYPFNDLSMPPADEDEDDEALETLVVGGQQEMLSRHPSYTHPPPSTAPPRPHTQLRTASRAPKKYTTPPRKPSETAEEEKARAAHNQVEQQYRKRLNTQFERLLAVLPAPDADEAGGAGVTRVLEGTTGPGESSTSAGGNKLEKRISKAEVLDLARRRIKSLEKERKQLERQNTELAGSISLLEDEWTRRMQSGAMAQQPPQMQHGYQGYQMPPAQQGYNVGYQGHPGPGPQGPMSYHEQGSYQAHHVQGQGQGQGHGGHQHHGQHGHQGRHGSI